MNPLLLLLIWPFVEIAGFVLVGRELGVLPTIGLTILSGVIGAFLMRYQGFGVLQRIQAETQAGRNPGRDIAHGVMILLAGVLLFIPGFFSDFIGLALFLPPVRDFAWKHLRNRMNISVIRPRGHAPYGTSPYDASPYDRGATIDLGEDDYSSPDDKPSGDPSSPWRRIDRDKPRN